MAEFIDHSDEVLKAFERAKEAALESMGNMGVSFAKQNLQKAKPKPRINTSRLINSITHLVLAGDDSVYIGTNVSYAIYNEMGTGIYISGGRKTPWSYKDDNGNWHRTSGLPPTHFLKEAAQNHAEEYRKVADAIMHGK